MAKRFYEMLIRGNSDGTTAFSVMLCVDRDDGRAPDEYGPMTPQAAEAEGFTFGSIVSGLNTALVVERDSLLAQIADLKNKLAVAADASAAQATAMDNQAATLGGEISSLTRQLSDSQTALSACQESAQGAAQEAQQTIADLQSQVDALKNPPADHVEPAPAEN